MKRALIFILLLLSFRCALAQKPAIFEIRKMPFNQTGFSEISPVILRDGILFCSNRRFSAVQDRTSFDGRRLYNIYIAEKRDSARWTKPRLVNSERVEQFNNGPLCISPDGNTVYFTSEIETGQAAKRRDFRNHNGIFIAEMTGTNLVNIKPFIHNNPGYEVAHPSVSPDGRYLYFASDMPGTLGKSDIWRSEFVNGEWSVPANLGPGINTANSESYPFVHASGKLYFTSDRPGGHGGLDVYSSSFWDDRWDEPVLLPEPLNSPSDDFAFTSSEDMQTGYFSTNRGFNDDIYMFTSTIVRKASCDEMVENIYCFRFIEENAVKYDTIPFVYRWRFGDGESAEGHVVEHCYPGPGKYQVRLDVMNLVTNELIANEKTEMVIIEDAVQPYITAPDSAFAGRALRLDAKSTNLPGFDVDRFYWNFGDETIDTGDEVSKTFRRPGVYNVQLIVTSKQQAGGAAQERCVSKNIRILSDNE